jgi:hypothetical protein
MPTIEIVLTEKQREYVEEIAPLFGKNLKPSIEFTADQWLRRILRAPAVNGNTIWHSAERDGKVEILDPKQDGKIIKTYAFSELEPMLQDYLYIPSEHEAGADVVKLVLPQTMFDALRHVALLDALSFDARGVKREWTNFNQWLQNFVDREIVSGKIWADSVAWEEDETEAFRAKPRRSP